MVGAELPRGRRLPREDVDGNDACGSCDTGASNGIDADTTDADHAHMVTRSDLTQSSRSIVSGGDCAPDQSRAVRGKPFRLEELGGLHHDLAGERRAIREGVDRLPTPGEGLPGIHAEGVVAVCETAFGAFAAMKAWCLRAHHHGVADPDVCHTLA